jgi:hypothetical protein
LATNDQASSSWTSRVRGGKSHELVVSVVGVIAGGSGQPDDGIAMGPDEATGLSDAVALGEVLEDGAGLLLGHAAVEQRGALALGEAGLAGLTVEEPDMLALAVAAADGEVAVAASPVEGTFRVLAAEAREVVHTEEASRLAGWVEVQGIHEGLLDILRRLIALCSVIQGHHPRIAPFTL